MERIMGVRTTKSERIYFMLDDTLVNANPVTLRAGACDYSLSVAEAQELSLCLRRLLDGIRRIKAAPRHEKAAPRHGKAAP